MKLENPLKKTVLILKYSLLVFALLFLWLNYEDEWLSVFGKYVCPYFFVSPKGWVTAIWIIITILFVVFVAIKLCEIYKRRTQLTANQTIMLLFVCVVYVKYRFFSELCERYGDTPIAYLDAYALLTVAFVLIGFRNYFSPRKKSILTTESEPFIPDKPVKNAQEDKLGYSDVAKQLVTHLKGLSLDESFSVGVVAPWGAGKSSFMNMVKDLLTENDFEVVDFNPRNSKNINNIQEDFFSALCTALSPYHFGMSSVLKPYMKALQLMEENKLANLFSFFYGLQDKETAKKNVEAVLKRLSKKVIIFIDDLDRLLVDEIHEVFKLIVENASFPNVVFVTAYDKSLIEKILRQHLHLGNNQNFIDKFFEYEMMIPLRPYYKVYSYLKNEIVERCGYGDEKPNIHETIIDNYIHLLSPHITTMRDAKRFVNLFVSDFEKINGEVDFGDFLLVSVIKYKSPEEHRRIYEKKLFLGKSTSQKTYLLSKDFDENYRDYPFKSIIKRLFAGDIDDPEENPYGRIYYADTFDLYFVTQIEGRLPQKEMQNLLEVDDFEYVKHKVEKWNQDNKEDTENFKLINYFIDYLSSKNIYKIGKKEAFTNYFRVSLLVYSAYTDGYNLMLPFLYQSNVNDFVAIYNFIDANDYKEFIKGCVMEQPACYPVTQKLLINHITNQYKDFPIILQKEELLDINKSHFLYYLGHESDFGEEHYYALCSCINKVDTREGLRAILDEECCKLAKDAIIKSPIWYIENFVRAWQNPSNPNRGNILPEEHWEEIFGDAISFEQFILEEKHNTHKKIELVRNFWKLYRQNDYQAIAIFGEWNVKQLMDDNLNGMMTELTKLENTNKEFQNLKSRTNSTGRHVSDLEIKEECERLLNKLGSNRLPIAFRKRLQEEIRYILASREMRGGNHTHPLA